MYCILEILVLIDNKISVPARVRLSTIAFRYRPKDMEMQLAHNLKRATIPKLHLSYAVPSAEHMESVKISHLDWYSICHYNA